MIGKILSSKVVTGIAYSLIGARVVRDNLTVDNARKVMSATRKAAATTGHTIRGKAAELKDAVNQRKSEILSAESGADTEVPEERAEVEAPDDTSS